ncbi:uncharacterized protein At1g01500 [Aristolochia californica]|uniref:uncharacterized protein At1g01500 n=1 Tax=Aristolochia californica TaxID=171875 RepID=UPI0035D5F82E
MDPNVKLRAEEDHEVEVGKNQWTLLDALDYDNHATIHIDTNLIFYERIKHIEIDRHFAREELQVGVIIMHYIPSKNQLTNIFTKILITRLLFTTHAPSWRRSSVRLLFSVSPLPILYISASISSRPSPLHIPKTSSYTEYSREVGRRRRKKEKKKSKMCRSVDHQGFGLGRHRLDQRDTLRIRSFHLHLTFTPPAAATRLPETLTLLYLPRINGNLLEINEAKINPNSPALVALHRLHRSRDPVFASTDRVRASEGVRFEVLAKEDWLLKGVFRRGGEGDDRDKWRLECNCTLEDGALQVSAAEVRVVDERCGEMREKVEMVPRRRRRRPWVFLGLEEIPEEREVEVEADCCNCEEGVMDREDEEMEEIEGLNETGMMEKEMETVRWAVDLGIWAMCLGVGVLVTKASAKSLLRRRKRFLI